MEKQLQSVSHAVGALAASDTTMMFISTSAFSYIRSADDASPVRSEVAVEQTGMIRKFVDREKIF